jgi:hypothetical protein
MIRDAIDWLNEYKERISAKGTLNVMECDGLLD